MRIDRRDSRELWVSIAGDIDLSPARTVVETVTPAVLPDATTVIDLVGVTFFGAAGITALLQIRACTQARHGSLLLIGATHRIVRRPLAACRLEHFFDWRDV